MGSRLVWCLAGAGGSLRGQLPRVPIAFGDQSLSGESEQASLAWKLGAWSQAGSWIVCLGKLRK